MDGRSSTVPPFCRSFSSWICSVEHTISTAAASNRWVTRRPSGVITGACLARQSCKHEPIECGSWPLSPLPIFPSMQWMSQSECLLVWDVERREPFNSPASQRQIDDQAQQAVVLWQSRTEQEWCDPKSSSGTIIDKWNNGSFSGRWSRR